MNKLFKSINYIYLGITFALAALMMFVNIYIRTQGLDEALVILGVLRLISLILVILIFTLWTPVVVISIIHAIKNETSITSDIFAFKLVYILFFLCNFINCLITVLGFRDFEVYGISKPIFIVLMVLMTYSVLLTTSIPQVVNFIKLYTKKKIKVSASGIIWSILLFAFVIDVVAIAFLYFNEKKYLPEEVNKRKLETLEKGKAWQNKKGMDIKLFKGLYIAFTALMYVFAILMVVSIIITISQCGASIDSGSEIVLNPLLRPSLIGLPITILGKFILGLVYGVKGKEDPSKFILKMKYIELPIAIVLFVFAMIMFITSSFFMVLGFALAIFFVVIIIALAVISLLLVGTLTLGVGVGTILELVLLIYSGNMCLFSFYLNQRKMNNKKFSKKMIVVYMVLLFVPILDIVAIHLLTSIADKNEILGDKPVIDITKMEK